MRTFLSMMLLLSVVACAMPATQVRTVEPSPSIIVKGAPDGSTLVVDGVSMGLASTYNGEPNVLKVIPGTHTVSVFSSNGGTILTRKIFVESEIKTIDVP